MVTQDCTCRKQLGLVLHLPCLFWASKGLVSCQHQSPFLYRASAPSTAIARCNPDAYVCICQSDWHLVDTCDWVRVPRDCPADIAALIVACMDGEPEERPTAKQIIVQVAEHVRRFSTKPGKP